MVSEVRESQNCGAGLAQWELPSWRHGDAHKGSGA